MLRLLLSLALVAALSGPAEAQRLARGLVSPIWITPVQRAAIENGIRNRLAHPRSAWFSNLFAGTNRKGVTMVCGYVNALGADGQDTGRQPFYGTLWMQGPRPVFEVYGFGGNVVRRRLIVHKCRRRGLPL